MLTPIHNTRELYCRMESLRYWQDLLQQVRICDTTDEDQRHMERTIVEAKRTIRTYYRTHRCSFEDDPRIVRDDGMDGCIVLIPVPERIDDEETAEAWYMNNHYAQLRYSAYDCTGQIYTSWHKIIKRGSRYYVYQSLHCDC